MSIVFTKAGFRSLRLAWLMLVVAIAAAAGVAWASHLYLQKEKRDGLFSNQKLSDAQSRVEAARRERDDLKASSEIFKDLVARGILQDEHRLDFIERIERLKTDFRLMGLEYEILPQRPLPLAGGRVYNAVEVLGSKVKVRAQAMHEGDALGFLETLARPSHGFNPLSECTLKRLDPGVGDALSPRVAAECTLEWITLKDKRSARGG